MISLDRTTATDRDAVSADELSTRIPAATVTRVPQGPTGLWDALAAAATRRRRAEAADVVTSPVLDLTATGAGTSGRTAVDLLDQLGVDVVPL